MTQPPFDRDRPPPQRRHPFYPNIPEEDRRAALERERQQVQPDPTNEIPVWAGQPPVPEPIREEVSAIHREQRVIELLLWIVFAVQGVNLGFLIYLLITR